MASIRLTVSRKLEREIKRQSKAMFPKESFALLLGTCAGDAVQFDELYVPDDVAKYSRKDSVDLLPHWFEEAHEAAKESELDIVGWVHSHPWELGESGAEKADHSLSERDLDCRIPLPVSGVCVVRECKIKGERLLRASLRWWGMQVPVEVTRN